MSVALHHPLFSSNGSHLRRWWWWAVIGFLFLCGTRVWAAAVTLAWDADADPSITGYNVHYGTSSGTYTDVARVNATTTTLANLFGNTTYYFTVTAVNTSGQEGAPSNEIAALTANTDLSNIMLDSGTLTPGFVANIYNYAVTVMNGVSTLNVAGMAASNGQTITVSGASVTPTAEGLNLVSLSTGNNQLTLQVTSPDGRTTNTYTVDVTRLNVLQSWRMQYFGTSLSLGSAADLATPRNDGVPNLVKFATGMDPIVPGVMPGTLAANGGNLAFTYLRVKAAVSDGTTCSVVWTDDLTSPNWSSDSVMESSVDQGATELVTDVVPMGVSSRRFVRLVVSHP